MRLSISQNVSFIQRVLITLVLRLIMNDGFSFDSSIACSELFRVSWGKSLVNAVRSSTKRNNKTHSCTRAKQIYIWRLFSSCVAPLSSSRARCPDSAARQRAPVSAWPLHNIAIINCVWCMAYKGAVGGGRILRNSRAIVLQWGRRCRWGGGNERMIDFHYKALK